MKVAVQAVNMHGRNLVNGPSTGVLLNPTATGLTLARASRAASAGCRTCKMHLAMKLHPKIHWLFAALPALPCLAQTAKIDDSARQGIDAGNQAWVDGMQQASAARIAGTYAADAAECTPAGECTSGRPAIERRLSDRFTRNGRAVSASVTSLGAVQQGDFVYEWGRAEAAFANGQKVAGRFLTVWHKQPDGSWKIFRNMALPPDGGHQ